MGTRRARTIPPWPPSLISPLFTLHFSPEFITVPSLPSFPSSAKDKEQREEIVPQRFRFDPICRKKAQNSQKDFCVSCASLRQKTKESGEFPARSYLFTDSFAGGLRPILPTATGASAAPPNSPNSSNSWSPSPPPQRSASLPDLRASAVTLPASRGSLAPPAHATWKATLHIASRSSWFSPHPPQPFVLSVFFVFFVVPFP